MSKLFKLKEWLTVEETAKHLTSSLNEDVSVADVYRLALDQHLTLSVYFPNYASANLGEVISYHETVRVPVPLNLKRLKDDPNAILPVTEIVLEDHLHSDKYLRWSKAVQSIGGVWDLTMRAGERFEVQRQYQRLINGPDVMLLSVNGVFLKQGDCYCRIVDDTDDECSLFPTSSLPEGTMYAVRTEAILAFLNEVNDSSGMDKPLNAKARNSYLYLIAALAKQADYDLSSRGVAASLEVATQQLGCSITDDTIRKILKEVNELTGKATV